MLPYSIHPNKQTKTPTILKAMNMSEVETSRPFRSVKDAAAAFNKYDSANTISSPGYGQKSTPVYYEISIMDSIKNLEMELTDIKKELGLMKKRRTEMEIAMAGINAQFHRSLSKLAEIEAVKAAQRSAVREEIRWEEEDDDDYWPCFGDALSICDLDTGLERRMEMKSQRKKPLVPLLGRIFSKKKSSSDATDYIYPESIYSVLS